MSTEIKSPTFPESVIDMLKGNLGQPPGGFPLNIIKKALGSENYIKERPGSKIKEKKLILWDIN